MRSLFNMVLVLAVVMAVVVMTGCQAPKVELVDSEVLAEAGLQHYWYCPVDLSEGEKVERASLVDENLYLLTNFNTVIAIDAARGIALWSYPLASKGVITYMPIHYDGIRLTKGLTPIKYYNELDYLKNVKPVDAVILGTITDVTVLNRRTGEVLRKLPLTFGAASTRGASAVGNYYVPDDRGWLYSLLLQEGVKTWTLGFTGKIVAPVNTYKGVGFVATTSGVVSSFKDSNRNKRIWEQKVDGPVSVAFQVSAKGCFVPCEDGMVYAFNTWTGQPLWEPYDCGKALLEPIQASDRTVFQYATGGKFHAINAKTGKRRWMLEDGRKVLAVIKGTVYVLDTRSRAIAIDEVSGRIKSSVPLTGISTFIPNTSAPAIFGYTPDGKVYCIRQLSAGRITPEMLKQLQ